MKLHNFFSSLSGHGFEVCRRAAPPTTAPNAARRKTAASNKLLKKPDIDPACIESRKIGPVPSQNLRFWGALQ